MNTIKHISLALVAVLLSVIALLVSFSGAAFAEEQTCPEKDKVVNIQTPKQPPISDSSEISSAKIVEKENLGTTEEPERAILDTDQDVYPIVNGETEAVKGQENELTEEQTISNSPSIETSGPSLNASVSTAESDNLTNNTDNVAVFASSSTPDTKATSSSSSKITTSQVLDNNGVYAIKSALNNKYVDIAGGSTSNGGNVQMYTANNTLAQFFIFKWIGEGWYYIINEKSGKYLDVFNADTANGTNIQQYSGNKTSAQKWGLRKNGDGTYSLVPMNAQKQVMDVTGANKANGANLQIYVYNGTLAQKFSFIQNKPLSTAYSSGKNISDGVYDIASLLDTKKVIDVYDGSSASGANVQLYSANGTSAQKIKITYTGTGLYSLQFLASGKMLDVYGGYTADGTNLQQYDNNGTLAQRWYFQKNTKGYSILSALCGKAVDVAGAKSTAGTNIQLYKKNDTNAQIFVLQDTPLVSTGTYTLQLSYLSSMVLDVSGGSKSNGGNVQTYRSNGTNAQKFAITYLGSGVYKIMNIGSKKYLDVYDGSSASGANVQQYTWNNTNAQKWKINWSTRGYSFTNVGSGKVLDISGASCMFGANVQQYKGNNTSAQLFNLKSGDWYFYSGASSSAMRYIEKAEQYQGLPYVWGGRYPSDGGFDCAGLVMYCANQTLGKNFDLLNTNAERLLNGYCYEVSAANARPGDLVFYLGTYGSNVNYVSHVVIYCGNGVMYGAGDPIGYNRVNVIRNIYGNAAKAIYARMA